MGRRGSWLRNLVGAAGTAVIVPVGLLVAVAVAAGVGGGGLGGLGQLVGGPTLPGQDPVVIALGGGDGTGPSAVPAVPTERPGARRDVAGQRPGSGSARGADPGDAGTTDTAGDRPGDTSGSTGPRPAPERPGPAATPGTPVATPAPPTDGGPASPSPTPAPDPVGDLVRGVGEVVDDIVRPLPVAGPPVADAVGTVIDLVAPPRTVAAPAAGATPAP